MLPRCIQVVLMIALVPMLVALPAIASHLIKSDWFTHAHFSTDGKVLAVSNSHGVTVVALGSGETATLAIHGNVALSPDGRRLVCVARDEISLWDWRLGRNLTRRLHDATWSRSIAVSPDGAFVAGVDKDRVTLWDLKDLMPLNTFLIASDDACVAFSPDSKTLVIGHTQIPRNGDDHEIRFLSIPDGKVKTVLKGPEYCYVRSLAISPDGRTLATGLSNHVIRVWDIELERELWAAVAATERGTLAFSTDGHWLVTTGGSDGALYRVANPPAEFPPGPRPEKEFRQIGEAIHAVGVDQGKLLISRRHEILELDPAQAPDMLRTVRSGVKIRSDGPVWALAALVSAWALGWLGACWWSRARTPAGDRSGESCLFWIVAVTAAVCLGQWALVVLPARADLRPGQPLIALFVLSTLLGMTLVVGLAIWMLRRPTRSGLAFRASAVVYCVVVLTGQSLFEVWAIMKGLQGI